MRVGRVVSASLGDGSAGPFEDLREFQGSEEVVAGFEVPLATTFGVAVDVGVWVVAVVVGVWVGVAVDVDVAVVVVGVWVSIELRAAVGAGEAPQPARSPNPSKKETKGGVFLMTTTVR
jgi:hypothetical protein